MPVTRRKTVRAPRLSDEIICEARFAQGRSASQSGMSKNEAGPALDMERRGS